ncbi:MAG: hypothetical protein ABSG30_14665 [Steroidobacteraceae bacterium]|jgi:hypothetical protein
MTNDKKPSEESKFSFGTRELRQAQREQSAAPAVDTTAPNPRDAGGGFDPYNSSGGFDRRKNWARVGKR